MLPKIEPYFLIFPDYEGCLGYYSVDNCNYGCDDDTLELEGYEITPFKVPGMEEWCYDWTRLSYKHRDGELTEEENEDWIERGLAIAQYLRQILPEEINLYYRKGDSDILIDKIDYFYLSPDVTSIIGDTNQCSVIYYGDAVEIGYFPEIPLPGLDKWWMEYDRHVDYADSEADLDFDWVSWMMKGLEFARIIRQHLPESVAVWFSMPFECKKIFPMPDLLVMQDGSFRIKEDKQ